MRAWVVRAGQNGANESAALADGMVVTGWDAIGDLSATAVRDDIKTMVAAAYPDESPYRVGNWTGQIHRFRHEMGIGDLVLLPLRSSLVAIGRVVGDYEYRADAGPGRQHLRRVEWLVRDLARTSFEPDLLDSMGSLLTVFELSRFGAASRLAAVAAGSTDPGRPAPETGIETPTEPSRLFDEIERRTSADPLSLSIRDFLAVWGSQRRYPADVTRIEKDLAARGLITVPPFTEGSLDTEIRVLPVGNEPAADTPSSTGIDVAEPQESTAVAYRISNLDSANREPESVTVGTKLRSAMTKMMLGGFSQLPVLDQENRLRGIVSWESIGRARMADPEAGLAAATVKAREADRSDDLLDWIGEIQKAGYVVVRDHDHRVCGMVTSADLSHQFGVRLRPFILVEEIEQRLRLAVDAAVPVELMRKRARGGANIQSAADLTFGAYRHILLDDQNWRALGWAVDRDLFLTALEDCRVFRNNLMHFSPDPITDDQLGPVQGLLELLRSLAPQVS